MKRFFEFMRYVLPYKASAILYFAFSLLSIFFSLFSMVMVIPFLGILFHNEPLVNSAPPLSLSADVIKENFYYFLSQIIVESGETRALFVISVIVVGATFFKTAFNYLGLFFMAILRTGVIKDVRNLLYNKILSLPLSYFSNEKKGDIISRMSNDMTEVEGSIVRSMEAITKHPISIVVFLIALLVMSPQLTLFSFIILPIAGVIIGKLGKNLRKISLAGQQKIAELLTIIEETLSGMRIVKAFNAELIMKNKFEQVNEAYNRISISMWRRRDMATPLSEFLGTMVIVIVMYYGGSLVLNSENEMTSQALIGYLIVFSQIINPAKAFSNAYYNIEKGLASLGRINEILDAENHIQDKENASVPNQFKHSIEYKNVSFKYKDEYVLRNINLKVEKGKSVALVGQSGGGKSTLVDLLPRFYETLEGEILIDGIPIKDLNISGLRSLIGNVTQESILFNDSIFNNIAFGNKHASQAKVEAAARVANAHQFIMETGNGYQTNIGDRGGKLSGGQRQRLSIARAILKNPPILILDEATSALDTESERFVQEALVNLMKNRTSIIIAHRLSTIKNTDEICVLHEGKIVERGKHDFLIQQNGYYKKLHKMQS